MTRGLADTSVFVARESGRPLSESDLPAELAVSVITVGELRAGVLAAPDVATRVRRLDTFTRVLAFDPIPVDQSVAEAWAHVRVLLRDAGARLAVNDSWIAATALARGLPLVTQDADYVELPDLQIIRV
ncbi:MAG TPA: type II toxin-antitoxin system VapC family toxin [Acidimicrobiales bacterium]|nr:type II toxin-antitoxin system VapC family toxin [Acidimicrobiales bacterium]